MLFELGSLSGAIANAAGLIEPLDWAAINPEPMFDEAKQPWGFGYQYYSTIMAWRSDAKPLTSWADFWNVRDFPGKRTLPDNVTLALPIALLADGVAPLLVQVMVRVASSQRPVDSAAVPEEVKAQRR